MTICVVRRKDQQILVRADKTDQAIQIDGAYYFHPDIVTLEGLEETDRTYECPHKGTCHWIDLVTKKGVIVDASWQYPEPREGYRHITGWYGFHASHRYYETKYLDN